MAGKKVFFFTVWLAVLLGECSSSHSVNCCGIIISCFVATNLTIQDNKQTFLLLNER